MKTQDKVQVAPREGRVQPRPHRASNCQKRTMSILHWMGKPMKKPKAIDQTSKP